MSALTPRRIELSSPDFPVNSGHHEPNDDPWTDLASEVFTPTPCLDAMNLNFVWITLGAFLISLALNRLMIKLGGKFGLMDLPGERRVHQKPIPRAGGIAIWISFLVCAYAIVMISPGILGRFQDDWLGPFALCSRLLVAVGVLDDRGGMNAWVKLLGQVAAASLFFALRPASQGLFQDHDIPIFIDGLIFVTWAVLLINAFNLIDGLDGLCGGLALIALVFLGLIAGFGGKSGPSILLFIMAGAVVGFLRYNVHPAKIFLGDAGSMLLGFFIAAAATQATGRRAIVGVILLPIVVAGVPLLDVLLAICRRSLRNVINQWDGGSGVRIFAPDKDHLHHRLLAEGSGQRGATRILHGLSVIIAILAFLPMIFGDGLIGISVVGLLVLSLLGLKNFARVELVQAGSMLHLAVKRPIESRALQMGAFFYDTICLTLASFAAIWLEFSRANVVYENQSMIQFTATFVLLGMLALFFVKAYRRVWSRATLRDVLVIVVALLVASLLCVSLISLIEKDLAFSTARMGMFASFFAILALALPRISIDLLRELAIDAGHRRGNSKGRDEHHVVVYGAGDLGNLFFEYLKTCSAEKFKRFRIAGFIDDNRALHGRMMRGFPVLGGPEDLPEIAIREKLHGVIVAINQPKQEPLNRLRAIASKCQLNLYSWRFDLAITPLEEVLDPVGKNGTSPAGLPQVESSSST